MIGRGNGFNWQEGRFVLATRKKVLTRSSLPREAMGAPSSQVFKTRLDGQPDLVDGNPAHGRELELRVGTFILVSFSLVCISLVFLSRREIFNNLPLRK